MTNDSETDDKEKWRRECAQLQETITVLDNFLYKHFKAGKLTEEDLEAISKTYNDIVIRAGGGIDEYGTAAAAALTRHGLYAMRVKAAELLPDEAEVIRTIGIQPGQNR